MGQEIMRGYVTIAGDDKPLDRTLADVNVKVRSTAAKGEKEPLMNTMLFGRRGAEGIEHTTEHALAHGFLGGMSRMFMAGGGLGLGIMLASEGVMHLAEGFITGGEAAEKMQEAIKKSADELHAMTVEGIKSSIQFDKMDAKLEEVFAGVYNPSVKEKLGHLGMGNTGDLFSEGIEQAKDAFKDANKHRDDFLKGDEAADLQKRMNLESQNKNDQQLQIGRLQQNPVTAEDIDNYNKRLGKGTYSEVTQEERAFQNRGVYTPGLLDVARFRAAEESRRNEIHSFQSQADAAARRRESLEAEVDALHEKYPYGVLPEGEHGGMGISRKSIEEFGNQVLEAGGAKPDEDERQKRIVEILEAFHTEFLSAHPELKPAGTTVK